MSQKEDALASLAKRGGNVKTSQEVAVSKGLQYQMGGERKQQQSSRKKKGKVNCTPILNASEGGGNTKSA